MGIRAKINEHPKVTMVVTLIAVFAVVGATAWNLFGGNTRYKIPQAYFTTDDMATGDAAIQALFADDPSKAPPFIHNGKLAYRANVYTCDGGRTKFIAYLERYTEDAKRSIDKAQSKLKPNDPAARNVLLGYMNSIEVKKPGSDKWVKVTDIRVSHPLMAAVCPNGGSNENIEPIVP